MTYGEGMNIQDQSDRIDNGTEKMEDLKNHVLASVDSIYQDEPNYQKRLEIQDKLAEAYMERVNEILSSSSESEQNLSHSTGEVIDIKTGALLGKTLGELAALEAADTPMTMEQQLGHMDLLIAANDEKHEIAA